ncbi:MAG: hypothetical protein EBQ99_05585 [Planctomycetes bacterium]|nr:hypothetical protein [Planctomycetota bacterium]
MILVTTGLRGGGTGNHAQTMTVEEFRTTGWRIYRYTMLFAAIGCGLSLLAAWPVAERFAAEKGYPRSVLLHTILVLTLNFALFNAAWFGRCRITSEGRVREISIVDSLSGAIKFFSTWILAASGAGPLALAGALTAGAVIEGLWTLTRGGLRMKEMGRKGPWLAQTFRELRLPLIMAVLTTLGSQTDALVGSILVPVTVIGFYFFAMQLASQPTMLVGTTLRAVFTSATAAVRGNPDRERESLHIVFNGAMVFIPLITMSIPAIFEPFERAVWGGRWADARWPVLILSIAAIYTTALQLVGAPIAGLRNWRLAIRLDLFRAIPKIVGAAIGGIACIALGLDAVASGIILAFAVGATSLIAATYELFRVLLHSGLSRGSIIYELYSTPLAALLSAVAAAGLSHSITEPLRSAIHERVAAGIEFGLSGVIYAILSLLLIRFGYTPTLERLLQAIPGPFATPLRKALRMPAA